jgi:aldehyde:ferredoxin oxidoreductase
MNQLYGWAGKILRVNLTTGTFSIINTSTYVPKYIGGIGISHRIAWDEIPKGTGAFDPENRLICMTGPLTGTAAPCSSRTEFSGVAPQGFPEQYAVSSMGGWFAAKLKWAGYDGIVFQGKAPVPSYLLIGDGDPQILPADNLWGLDTFTTQMELRRLYGDYTESAVIGPAGEHLVRIATIHTNLGNAAAQGGFGGVAGSKNLKAICITKRDYQLKVANPNELLRLRQFYHPIRIPSPQQTVDVQESPWRYLFDEALGSLVADAPVLTAPYPWKRKSCSNGCFNSCYFYDFKDVPLLTRPGTVTTELGCVGGRFAQALHKNPKPLNARASLEVNALSDQLGLNQMELHHGLIPWMDRARQMGLDIESHLGMLVEVEKPEFWVKVMNMIAYRQGFGDQMAEGTARTVRKLGKEEYGDPIFTGEDPITGGPLPVNLDGLGGWGYPTRSFLYEVPIPWSAPMALCWMADTRDPHHSKWPDFAAKGYMEWALSETEDPLTGPTGVRMAYFSTIRGNLIDMLTMCWAFPIREGLGTKWEPYRGTDTDATKAESEFLSAVTGINVSEVELDKAAKMVTTLHRAIAVRNYDRNADMDWNEIAIRLINTCFVEEDKFKIMVCNFYEKLGWDRETGRPTRATLEELGLKDVADELESLGKLPQVSREIDHTDV